MKKKIRNMRDGHHLNSKYWQDWKKNLPNISSNLFQIMTGIVLSDATMYHVSKNAYIKFEQGVDQKEFLFHLFDMCKDYCFIIEPSIRYHTSVDKCNQAKSYWFKTFSFPSFSIIWDLFYSNRRKVIREGVITTHVTEISLAYWIIGDGSLHREGRVLTLHTQGFTKKENDMISKELNQKFSFNTKVIVHKTSSYVIQFSTSDANKVHDLINPHMIPSMKYKVPRKL